MVTEGRESCM